VADVQDDNFVAVDMPKANRLTVGIMALVADEERHMIARTKAALAATKRRGVKPGGDRGAERQPSSGRSPLPCARIEAAEPQS
jgi:DNA invertase Pin-like site-specific DNA recombinase